MKRTPLFPNHHACQAKLVDFAGWEMPIQYSGVIDEYQTVRSRAGLFDVSHMGRIAVTGGEAPAFLQRVTTNDVMSIPVHHSQYSMICNPQGGIEDDIFIYHTKDDEFLVCVNASNREKIVTWLQQHLAAEHCTIQDRSNELAQLALQGPASRDLVMDLGLTEVGALKSRQCAETTLSGQSLLVTRTGYTGELGYEFYLPSDLAGELWARLIEIGRSKGLKPAGLGARDLLRLEMGYLLYGNDINQETTPLEAGAEWVVRFEKGEFIGREVLLRQQAGALSTRLVAFELLEKAVPRHGFTITDGHPSREPIGTVTSGNLSPRLQKGIGLGYVPVAMSKPGARIHIDIRGRLVPAVVVKPPFYKKPKS
jgi:aminomethyltransferase